MNARITYRYDETSDQRAWIVDIEDDAGSETLSVHPTEKEARLEAKRQSARRGLDCYRVDMHGVRTSA